MMEVHDPEKAKVEKLATLENSHLKGVKWIRRWPPCMRKKMKEYG